MPIYEYECDDCGHALEALQKLSDDPLSTCPECATDALKKKISAPGFRLSGSGWYETDFKSDKQRNLSKSDSADKDGGKGKSDSGSSEAKSSGAGKKSGGSAKEAAA